MADGAAPSHHLKASVVLIDVPSEPFRKYFGEERAVSIRAALHNDVWSALTKSGVQFQDVSVGDVRGDSERVRFDFTVVTTEANHSTSESDLRRYLSDRFGCFASAATLIRTTVPAARPSAFLRECFVNGVALESPPPPPPMYVREEYRPPAREHITSPSREHHVKTFVRESHATLQRYDDAMWYEAERRPRPQGGYKVDDLLLGQLKPTARATDTGRRSPAGQHDVEYDRRELREQAVREELARRHGYGPSQRSRRDRLPDQHDAYLYNSDAMDQGPPNYAASPAPRHSRTSWDDEARPAASPRARRRVDGGENRSASRRATPRRHYVGPSDEYEDVSEPNNTTRRLSRYSAAGSDNHPRRVSLRVDHDAAVAADGPRLREFSSQKASTHRREPTSREVDDVDDVRRPRHVATSQSPSASRRYVTRGGEDMPRRH